LKAMKREWKPPVASDWRYIYKSYYTIRETCDSCYVSVTAINLPSRARLEPGSGVIPKGNPSCLCGRRRFISCLDLTLSFEDPADQKIFLDAVLDL
jgi:hypothetical protein